MELTIEQLADLSIAIKTKEVTNKELETSNKTLETRNQYLVKSNRDLDKELKLQDGRISDAKLENNQLRQEKEGILSNFEIANEKNYKALRKREEKANNDGHQNALRLIEIDKREGKLVNKEATNKAIVSKAKQISADTRLDAIAIEQKEIDLQAIRKKIKLDQEKANAKISTVKELEKNIDAKRIELQAKESEILESVQENRNLVAELNHSEKTNALQIVRLEKLNALLSEYKNFIAENDDATIEDFEKILDTRDEQEIVELKAEEEKVEELGEDIIEDNIQDEVNTKANEEALKQADAEGVKEVIEKTEEPGEVIQTEPNDPSIKKIVEETVPETPAEDAVEKDPAILSEMNYPTLLKEAKARGLTVPQHINKPTLIDLLSK